MDRKGEILDCAEALARSRGYDGFSYADIEDAVGIRKASIHHHFRSKAELSLALIKRYGDRFRGTLDAIAEKEATAGGKLSRYLDVYRRALAGGKTVCLCVAFSAGRDSLSDPVLKQVNRFHRNSVDWLQGVFDEAGADGSIEHLADTETEAAACLALVEGAQLIARAAANPKRFDSAVAGLRARIR